MKTKQLTKLSLLTAIALSLFVVEMRIPNPVNIPGVKLGLANIITVYAVYCFKKGEVILMVTTKGYFRFYFQRSININYI